MFEYVRVTLALALMWVTGFTARASGGKWATVWSRSGDPDPKPDEPAPEPDEEVAERAFVDGRWMYLYSDGTRLPLMAGGADITAETLQPVIDRAEAEAKAAYANLQKLRADIAESGINPLGSSTDERDAFDKLDEAGRVYDEKKQEVAELRAKMSRLLEFDALTEPVSAARPALRGADIPAQGSVRMTMGRRFVESAEYKALHERGAFASDVAFVNIASRLDKPVEMLTKDELSDLFAVVGQMQYERMGATTVTGGGSTSAGPFIQNDLQAGFIPYARKRLLIAALVGQGTTDSDVVEYVTQSAPTDAAAETAEDSAAPESTYAFATNTTNVREITHYVPITNRAMADYGQMKTIIDGEIGKGVLDRLDTQIVSGNGSGQNLTGILNTSGIGTGVAGSDRAAALHRGITAIRVAAGVLGEPDAIGIHPADYEDLVLETDANGNFRFGPPSQQTARTCWGLPLISSTVFTSGTPIVGDFEGSARLWLREGLAVTTGLNNDDFTKRRVSVLGVLRAAFAVTRPGGFYTVTSF